MTAVRIVADDAVPFLDQAFGQVHKVRGAEITREHLRDADALIVRSVTRVDAALVEDTPLRFVGSATAGVDHVDLAALTQRRIAFANAPGCNARAVVEYVLAATLGVDDLAGPVGVVGFGQVGRRLTTALRRLGLRVLVSDPPRAAAGFEDEVYLPLSEVLSRSRTLSLHVPRVVAGPHATTHLIDADALARLPWGAVVINTSRGDVVDNAALQAWLAQGSGTAVLDVWEGEPELRWGLVGSPRMQLGTPHIAGYSLEGKARGTAMVHEALCATFERPVRFRARDVLPSAASLPQDLDTPATLAAVHGLRHTHQALRALARLPVADRAEAFERLRRTYPFRRELSAFAPPPSARGLWDALTGL